MRHSARETISAASVAAALNAPLTETGRDEARELGSSLQPGLVHRFFTSPVPRCAETAKCMIEGFERNGGSAQSCGPRRFLGAEFVKDEHALVRRIGELGLRGFFSAWVEGGLEESMITPIEHAGSALVSALEETSRTKPALCVDVHVTHDIVVLALLSVAWSVGERSFPWPGFLDGALIWRGEKGLTLWYHDSERVVS